MCSELEGVFLECDSCRSNICCSNQAWMIGRSVEVLTEKYKNVSVETLEDDLAVIVCAYCGSNIKNFEKISDSLKGHANKPRKADKFSKLMKRNSGELVDACNKCGITLGRNDIQVTIECFVGKIEYNSQEDKPDFCIDDRIVLCTYCKDCGAEMDKFTLREKLIHHIVKNPINRASALTFDLSTLESYPANKIF